MGMTRYAIKTLKSEDFDLLPYSRVKESCGITDRFLKVSYIRDTGDTDYDTDTLLHEIQEMENETSPFGWSHEDRFGVRYKSWFQKTFIPESKSSLGSILGTGLGMFLAPFTGGTSLAFLNPATLGTLGGGIGGYQEGKSLGSTLMGGLKGFGVGSLGTGLQAMAGPATGLKGNMGEFLAGASKPAQTVANWFTPTPKATGMAVGSEGMQISRPSSLMGNFADTSIKGTNAAVNPLIAEGGTEIGGLSSGMNAAYNASKLSSGLAAPALAGFSVGANTPSLRSLETLENLGTPSATTQATQPQSLWSKFFQSTPTSSQEVSKEANDLNLKKIATSVLIPTVTNAMFPTPDVPVTPLKEAIISGESIGAKGPLGKLAEANLTDILQTKYSGLPAEYSTVLANRYAEQDKNELKQYDDRYHALRSNATVENDSTYARGRAEIISNQTQRNKDLMFQAEQEYQKLWQDTRMNAIANALETDTQSIEQMLKLADLDQTTLVNKYGMDIGTQNAMKDMASKIGGEILQSGLPSSLSSFNIGSPSLANLKVTP